jgi:hypothetical protein
LKWDSWPYSNQDFDLWLFRWVDNTPVGFSANPQTGTQAPTERFCYTNGYTYQLYYLAIGKYNATSAPRFDLFVDTRSLSEMV